MTIATAPGKIILLGEHAVVYGRPAIAAPVWETVASARITAGPPGGGCVVLAPDVGLQVELAAAGEQEPLAVVTRLALHRLGLPANPDWQIELRSQIPIASGLGSGAALSTALVRAIFAHAGRPVSPQVVSELVYESERFYHGTPSGIDNTVIAFGVPIWFVRGQPPEPFVPGRSLRLAIADSGVRSPTIETVGDVRRGWEREPVRYTARFTAIGALVQAARQAMAEGDLPVLGRLMDENQAQLAALGVSSAVLEELVAAARGAGALGAKLSGGGRGGNVIALMQPATEEAVRQALLAAGAVRVVMTTVEGRSHDEFSSHP